MSTDFEILINKDFYNINEIENFRGRIVKDRYCLKLK